MTASDLGTRGIELGNILAGESHEPVVYFARFGAGVVKIGTSTRLLDRTSALYLRLVDVFLVVPGGRAVERAFHERFAVHRIQDPHRWELFSLAGVLCELQLMGLYSPAVAADPPTPRVQPQEQVASGPPRTTIADAVAEGITGPTVDAVRQALHRDPSSPRPVGRRRNADEYDQVELRDWEESRRTQRGNQSDDRQ